MQKFFDVRDFPVRNRAGVLTFGNFDGVHLGHQALIESAKALTAADETLSVMTFTPHPLVLFGRDPNFFNLLTSDEQAELLVEAGANVVIQQKFDWDFSRIKAESFLTDLIEHWIKPRCIVVGQDCRFGEGGKGDLQTLHQFGLSKQIKIIEVKPKLLDSGETISSRLIRSLLRSNKVEEASTCLGRPYFVQGEVVRGNQKGGELGFQTANLEVLGKEVPLRGVFITEASFEGNRYESVTNVGFRPTFGTSSQIHVECHVLRSEIPTLYGKKLKVEFLKFLREERKFSSEKELKVHIANDVKATRDYFSHSRSGQLTPVTPVAPLTPTQSKHRP